MLIVPILVSQISPDDHGDINDKEVQDRKIAQWQKIWFIYAAIMIVGNIVFVIIGKGTPAKWTRDADPPANPVNPETNNNNNNNSSYNNSSNDNQVWSTGHNPAAVVPIGMTTEDAKPAF